MAPRPLQNRVKPTGEIVATSARGTYMGNRGGRLHRDDQSLGKSRWASRSWICCQLSFKDRHRQVMSNASYTELFFLDEATALAAGHRPCFECRRHDALAFADAITASSNATQRMKAADIDRCLHTTRLNGDGTKRTYQADIETLPSGVMFRKERQIVLIASEGSHYVWSFTGYTPTKPLSGYGDVMTPKPIVDAIRHGYQALVHVSAQRLSPRL